MNAKQFIKELKEFKSKDQLSKLQKFFKGNDGKTKAFGVKFGDVFKLAKKFMEMPLGEIEKLLESKYYEIRMGAVSIMDYRAKSKKTPDTVKKGLYNLYLRRHDRLNNWDFVDRGAYNIIGEYLQDKPRDILYKLVKSDNVWERRTAIVSTYAFIKNGDLEDTFRIAEFLINDENEYINKAVGSWIREAGKKDEQKLREFLNKFASTMPRITLRYALEKLDDKSKKYYLKHKF